MTGEVTTRFKNLFKIHRFSYTITDTYGTTTHGSHNCLGSLRTEFSMALDNLALSGSSGDTVTFELVKE